MNELIEKANELTKLTGNLRMQVSDILADLEAYQKELIALIKKNQ